MSMLRILLILSFCWVFTACTTTTQVASPDLDARAAELDKKAEMISQQQQAANEKISAAQSAEAKALAAGRAARAAEAKMMASQSSMASQPGQTSLFPPNAVTGSCYARLFVPNSYQRTTETVLKREAGEKIEIIPAAYETVTERVLVKEASQRLEIVPAVYGYDEETVMVTPAKTRIVAVPETYETVTEKILVRPAHTEWKRGTGPIQRIDESTGEIMCLVEEPALYKNVSSRVLKTKATTKEIVTPAVYKTVKRRVMTKEPTTRVVEIPAEYKTIKVSQMVRAAQQKRIAIPAEYQQVTKKVVDKVAHMEWREILCETNMTRSKITQVQQALKAKGFNPGPIDGSIGTLTMKATNEFQKKNKLLVTKYLTINTLKALGVQP